MKRSQKISKALPRRRFPRRFGTARLFWIKKEDIRSSWSCALALRFLGDAEGKASPQLTLQTLTQLPDCQSNADRFAFSGSQKVHRAPQDALGPHAGRSKF